MQALAHPLDGEGQQHAEEERGHGGKVSDRAERVPVVVQSERQDGHERAHNDRGQQQPLTVQHGP